MPQFLRVFAILSACGFGGIAYAADPAPSLPLLAKPAVEHVNDVTYAKVYGESLKLDLAIPKTGGPFPAVIGLHGGAWKYGSRKDLSRTMIHGFDEFARGGSGSLLDLLATRGYVGVSASYRLAPKHKFPAQIEDVKTAVRFLRANAKKYNIDPERIAVCGFSAGGHLACLAATTPGVTEFAGTECLEQSDAVTCAVNFFGPTDLTLYTASPAIEKAYMVPLLGGTSKEKPELFKRASPVEHASKSTAPILTIHGTADLIVPVIHAERFHEKLIALGAKSEYIPVRGKGHGWGGDTATETISAMCKFLDENLKGKR